MEQGSKGRPLNASYSLRRQVVQKSMSTIQSHGELQLGSQIHMDSTPQAPKVKKAKAAPKGNHQCNNLKWRLEIAAILLKLAQDVPSLVPEVGCTINLQQELLRIQECSSKGSKSTSSPKKGTSVNHGQRRKHLGSLDSGPVRGPEWTAARDKEDMFFPHLEDSSLMAEAKERKRREMVQESRLRQMAEPVEERYITNAAVLPDLRPLPPVAPSLAQTGSLLYAALSEPLLTHGHSVEDYQAIYRSVVDSMLKTESGNARWNNVGVGHAIKQRLWERMSCPTTESFSAPSLKFYAPQMDVDISGEPLSGQPQRKKTRR